jgi:hypothetical protein
MRTFSTTSFLVIFAIAMGVVYLGGLAADNTHLSWLSVASASAEDYEILQGDEVEWTGQLAAGKEIEVSGINGKIIAKPADGRTARITGVKEAHRGGDIDAVQIRFRESSRGVKIWAKYPEHNDWDDDHNAGNVSVEFTVYVPSGVTFSGNTVNGGIEAHGLEGPVDLNTVNGSIKLSTTQDVEANTVNGNIKAEVASGDRDEPLSLETVNGSIELRVPKNLDADFYAETVHGSITSDFPVTLQGRFGPKEISGKIGKGGRELRLATVNGSIKLLEMN